LESGVEDSHFGVRDIVDPSADVVDRRHWQELALATVTEILTAVGLKMSGFG
jgi:hypothetical protein